MNSNAHLERVAENALVVRSSAPALNLQSDLLREHYYTEHELGKVLGRCVRTLRLWHQQRRGPARTMPPGYRVILYAKKDVLAWLEKNKQPVRETRKRRAR
jgi:hypothetical protein